MTKTTQHNPTKRNSRASANGMRFLRRVNPGQRTERAAPSAPPVTVGQMSVRVYQTPNDPSRWQATVAVNSVAC
jgi:hypothetical protein